MKFQLVLVLSLAALAYAGPTSTTPSYENGAEKRVTIDEDGTITVLSSSGKKIVISKAVGHPGAKNIDITVDGPFGHVKRIQVDGETSTRTFDMYDVPAKYGEEDREKRSSKDSKDKKNKKSQTEVLSQIFKEFEGVVDEPSYENLLGKVNSAVQAGELNPAVYEVLQSLNHYKYAETYGNSPVPFMVRGYPYGNQYATPQQQGQYQGVGVSRLPFIQQYFGAREQFQQGKEAQYPQQYYQKPQQYYQQSQQYYPQPQQYYQQPQQYYKQSQQYYQQPQQYYQQYQQYYQQPEQMAFSPRWTQLRSFEEPSVNPMYYF